MTEEQGPVTHIELDDALKLAAKSCRCDGGNTMNCSPCSAERRLRQWGATGVIVRRCDALRASNPEGWVVNLSHSRNRRGSPRVGDLIRMGEKAASKPRYIMHKAIGAGISYWCHLAGVACEICDRRKHV